MEEIAALYDRDGHEIGSAPRSRGRAENLHHAATGVVVFDPAGRIFVQQRTEIKDVYPGLHDFTAGGVIQAGEDPADSAAREAEEELGVISELHRIGEAEYADANTTFHAFLYWTLTDRPLRLQPEEVQGGSWMTRKDLLTALTATPEKFMPDSVQLLGAWLRNLTTTPPTI